MPSILRICEIYRSLQGESSRAGRPCAFIRLSGCNLDCAWCDSEYSRNEQGRELTVAMAEEALLSFQTKLVEITGGEPLIQPASVELAMRLARAGREVLVETNGSLDISLLPYPVNRIMDLKPPSSGMAGWNRWENLAHLRRGDEVKFVLAGEDDYNWARSYLENPDYPSSQVVTLFSPVAGKLAPADLAEWILRDQLDVRLNLQLHRVIWPGRERGV
ncbi:MAG: radical SAM protein [Planctomycetota bacterium]|jgi:7-carboxy-7-deazaguanine synthase|nr:radical SAM protein [Planctomycetota bacterium]